MLYPENLFYTKSHEWFLKVSENSGRFGLTDFAQDQLGDIVFVNLPSVGAAATAEAVISDVESVKAVSDVFSPATGTVSAINEALLDSPELVNSAPYESWFVEFSDITGTADFLTAEEYERFCNEQQ